MRVREIIVEHYLIEVNLEKLATQPVKGGQTVGSAVAKKLSMNPALHIDAEDHVGALEIIAGADPTPNNAYTRWLARIFIAPDSNFRVPEDNQQVHDELQKYYKLAKGNKLAPEDKRIDKVESLVQFRDILDKYPDEEANTKRETAQNDMQKLIDDPPAPGATFLIKDSNFAIINTTTREANCHYSGGAKWCTTKDDFNTYAPQGPIYIILDNHGTKPRQYQYHYESGQCNNKRNDPVNEKEVAMLSQNPGWTKFLNMEIKKHYKPIYDEIKDII